MIDGSGFVFGSGNVFADLELNDPEEVRPKAGLAYAISEIIAHRGWTQARAGESLGIDQPEVSAVMRGQLSGFSLERLLRFLTALDQDVTITIVDKAPSRQAANIAVVRKPAMAVSEP